MRDESVPRLGQLVEALAVAALVDGRPGKSWLQQLREAMDGGASRNAAGAGEQWRIPLNAAAADAWRKIGADIASLLEGASQLRPSPVPQVNLLAWWAAYTAAKDRGELVTSDGYDAAEQYDAAAWEKLSGWVATIRGIIDPPRTKHIMLPCPLCGAQRIVMGEGDAAVVTDALVIEFRPGVEAIGYCRNAGCGGVWVGEFELIALGRAAGARINFDQVLQANVEVPRVVIEERVIAAFDPEDPEHVALWREREERASARKETPNG